jgi:flavin-binding protein dodecin
MAAVNIYGNREGAMHAVKYLFMGMGFMALLVVGSCSMLTYKAVEVAGNSGDAIDRLEKAADRQVTRARAVLSRSRLRR